MGLFSSSKKTTNQTTNNYLYDDDLVVSGYGDLDAEGGSITDIKGVKESTVNVYTTDQGTVRQSMHAIGDALKIVDSITLKNLDSNEDIYDAALDSNRHAYTVAMDFAQDSQERVFTNVEDGYQLVAKQFDSALDYMSGAQDSANYFAASALEFLDEQADHTASVIQDNAQNAMRYVSQTTRSEQDVLFDRASDFGKWALAAFAVLTIGVFYFGRARG